MAEIGLNFPGDMRLSPHFAAAVRSRWLRVVLLPDVDLTTWIDEAHELGIKIIGAVARESIGEMTYEQAAEHYAELYDGRLDALQVGNESDHDSSSSWVMTPAELNALLLVFNEAFGFEILIIGPGLVSGLPGYLLEVNLDLVDAIAVHPYGQRPNDSEDWSELPGNFGNVNDLLDGYAQFDRPIWITEVGVSTTECSETFQARYCMAMLSTLKQRTDVPVVCWFCADDAMVPKFGLFEVEPKLAVAAFIEAAEEDPVPAPNYTVGPGVLAKMTEDGTTPGSDECYYPVGVKPSQWSETMGKNGTIYRYLFATNETYRFPPDQ